MTLPLTGPKKPYQNGRSWRRARSPRADDSRCAGAFEKPGQNGRSWRRASRIDDSGCVKTFETRPWKLIPELANHFGTRWLCYRMWYAFQQRSGLLRLRSPARPWSQRPLGTLLSDARRAEVNAYADYRRDGAPPFFFDSRSADRDSAPMAAWDAAAAAQTGESALRTPDRIVEDLEQGRWFYFETCPLTCGFPPAWHTNPLEGRTLPREEHWSRLGDFDSGDIKIVWELSRFAFTFALVRAHARRPDERYAELFWQLIEDWREHNPPQRGANWKCGQEVSLRSLAWCFGLYGFLHCAASTPQRIASLAEMLAVSARRIEANLPYALSQNNNHGISEAAGLWTIGVLFPEFKGAARWAARGRALLERLARTLVYDDGTFAQNSLNYHRVMLHAYVWAMRLGEVQGARFSDALYERMAAAGDLLYQLQDLDSGGVPNYGQNDGALVLPLTQCAFHDFRPVVQSARYLTSRRRTHADGPWDEELYWLFGAASLERPADPPPQHNVSTPVSGYVTRRSRSGFLFTRAGAFRHRPSQADALHVDVWWRGQNMALDAGTYSYHAPPPWDNPLAHTACHNTVGVDGQDQMRRAGRFLWLPWLSARSEHPQRTEHPQGAAGSESSYWEASFEGFPQLDDRVRHRRAVIGLGDDHWLVLDHLCGARAHAYRLHWLLAPFPHGWCAADDARLLLRTPAGDYQVQTASSAPADWSITLADPRSSRGWQATYGTRQPALSLAGVATAEQLWFWTLLGPGHGRVTTHRETLYVNAGDWRAEIGLDASGPEVPLARTIRIW